MRGAHMRYYWQFSKKRKKVSFEHNSQKTKRPRLQSTSKNDVTEKETQEENKENIPESMETATSSLEVLAEVAEVAQAQSTNSCLPDLIGDPISGADCPCEEDDDEMPPLEDEVTEL